MEYITPEGKYYDYELHSLGLNINLDPDIDLIDDDDEIIQSTQTPNTEGNSDKKSTFTMPDSKSQVVSGYKFGGYLNKKGDVGLLKSYKKRWFQCESDTIGYYDKEQGAKKGNIMIKDIKEVLPSNVKYGFNILTKGTRVYELHAFSEEDKIKWISSLKDVLGQK